MEIASGKKKKKKKIFFFFLISVRIASYVRKPVKTAKIRKTHVKNVQVDTSAVSTIDGSSIRRVDDTGNGSVV